MNLPVSTVPTVMTIAGSDSSGGAGIQADLKTIAATGCFGLSVITAVTAQNTLGVQGVHHIPVAFIREQFLALACDIGIDAVKIGMIGSIEAAETLSELLATLNDVPVVLDTVFRSTAGQALFPEASAQVIPALLFPRASLVTPNLPEAAVLTGRRQLPSGKREIESTARELHALGAASVLVKGGHGTGAELVDGLLHNGEMHWFSNPRIATANTHGTGCTLSSAAAGFLARGLDMVSAVEAAIAYTHASIAAGTGWRIGNGNGPLQHFHGHG